MTNKSKVEKVVSRLGKTIGVWNSKMDEMTKQQLDKVLDSIEWEEDTDVSIKRKKHVVEIDMVDDEIDFKVLTKAEYINRYGDERYQ